MALTGNYETDDGITHENAIGLVFPLVIQTFPEPAAKFDFTIWHNSSALENNKQPIKQISFSITGENLYSFISAAQNDIVENNTPLINAAVAQMESVVLRRTEFADWERI